MSDSIVKITQRDIGKMIAAAAHSGPWLIPLFKAVGDGLIDLSLLQRGAKKVETIFPATGHAKCLVILLGDDDGDDRGPAGWECAEQVIKRSRAVMLNASGGEAQHYALAVMQAQLVGTVLMIETASRHVEAWSKLLVGKSVMAILPRGGQHPIDMRETRH